MRRSPAEKSAVLIAVEDIGERKNGNIRMEIIKSFKAEIFETQYTRWWKMAAQ